jgi:hypothetical protein
MNQVLLIMERRDIVLQTDTFNNFIGFTRKGKQKNGVAKLLMIKKFVLTVITLENYFITWNIVFTIRR